MRSTSKPVSACQICGDKKLESIIFLGYLPPVNQMHDVGRQPEEQPSYPADLLYCVKCHLVQLGIVVNKEILFPPEYPYTSSTTKVLNALNIKTELRNLSFLNGTNILADQVKIKELNILFKKII